jgi:hypothetical protein
MIEQLTLCTSGTQPADSVLHTCVLWDNDAQYVEYGRLFMPATTSVIVPSCQRIDGNALVAKLNPIVAGSADILRG